MKGVKQEPKYCIIPLIQGIYIRKIHRDETYNGGRQGFGEGGMGVMFDGYRIWALQDEEFWR